MLGKNKLLQIFVSNKKNITLLKQFFTLIPNIESIYTINKIIILKFVCCHCNNDTTLKTIKTSIYSFKKTLNKIHLKDETLNNIPLFNKVNKMPGGILDKRIFKNAKKPLYGNELFSMMQNQLISLNIHPGVSKNEASNMRLFEATGVGSLLLTDFKDNINSFFDTDTEIVTYNSIEEALEKAKYLLNNPSVALRIAEAGKKRVGQDHTFYNRAPILAEGLTKQFK